MTTSSAHWSTSDLLGGSHGPLPEIRSVYQPIVRLDGGPPVGFEALARGPAGSELESPAAIFRLGAELGLEAELDVSCQTAAMRGALLARLPTSIPLFINAEPRWLGTRWPAAQAAVRDQAQDRLQIVVEITERALVDDPASLLGAVRRIRANGWGVALDDIGADPASLALMPFVEPDVIKLDLRLTQRHDDADVAAIVNAVIAQAERTGALILAEGIETPEHLDRALAMGATLGQGWLLGRPAPLPRVDSRANGELVMTRSPADPADTPFQAVQGRCVTRIATKGLLLPMSHHLERHALRTTEQPVLLACFEDAGHFTPGTARRYERLAARCSFAGALGVGMPADPVQGIRGAHVQQHDPLSGEWVVCVVGPHFAGALIARDLGDQGPDRERRFEMAITYDRDVVIEAANSMLARIEPING